MLLDKVDLALLRRVRYWLSAAANLPLEIESRWLEQVGVPIHQGYGLTETSPFASYNHLERYKPGSIGTPIDQVQMKVIDVEDGRDLGAYTPGEVLIRGPNVMLGYWQRPVETAEALRGGWFHSGDIGYQDDEGYFFLVDRLKDMINVGGLKVYPAEVENVLYRHPGVGECAVYGVPDPLLGERVKAHIVPKAGNTAGAEAMIAFCRGQIADYKVPSVVEFVTSIPKNPTGKILKRVLQAAERPTTATDPSADRTPDQPDSVSGVPVAAQGATAVETWLVAWLAAELQRPEATIDRDLPFAAYGVTSLQAVRLIAGLGTWLGTPLSAVLAWSHPSIQALARQVATGDTVHPGPETPVRAADSSEPPDLNALSAEELATLLATEIAVSRQSRTS
jgi:long-chain acyl-CoA synthetase